MPLHTSNNTIGIVLSLALFLFLSLAIVAPLNAEEQDGMVLPSMTVFAVKKSDNTFIQKSEVEWHDANDPTIVREKDGTYTAKSATNPYSLNALLASLGRPTVNIDLAYAANSVSMTAEGHLSLTRLLESFAYLADGVTLELTPTLGASEQVNRRVMQRRVEVLRKVLERNTGVNFRVMPSKVVSRRASIQRRSEVWRIQLRRES